MSSWQHLLTCDCLGNRILGVDTDEMLAYQTPKVVMIKDRLLGVLKYTLMLCIFCYVFVWQLMYQGSHFYLDHLNGVARLQLQHPTKSCNPMDTECSANYTSFQSLPYCNAYKGKNASVIQRECKYFDALDLLTPMDSGYLIPSFVQIYDQVQSCEPNASNNYACDKRYDYVDAQGGSQRIPGRAEPVGEYFVADIDSFTVLIDHSFRIETGTVEYDDHKMQGYWLDCSNIDRPANSTWLPTSSLMESSKCVKRPIVCMHDECKQLGMIEDEKTREKAALLSSHSVKHRGRYSHRRDHLSVQDSTLEASNFAFHGQADSDGQDTETILAGLSEKLKQRELYSIPPGDVLSLRTLYAMAGRSLDDWWYDPQSKGNMTTRKRGTVLVVNIHYTNLKPWTLFQPMDPPEYTISVTSQPVDKFKNMKAQDLPDKHRKLTVSYGTLVIVRSSGSIGVFRMIHMLIVVSTSLGLLAAASVVTDVLALYVLPLRQEYFKAKYEETEDYHDLRSKQQATTEDA